MRQGGLCNSQREGRRGNREAGIPLTGEPDCRPMTGRLWACFAASVLEERAVGEAEHAADP
jgi:hypothetical protein